MKIKILVTLILLTTILCGCNKQVANSNSLETETTNVEPQKSSTTDAINDQIKEVENICILIDQDTAGLESNQISTKHYYLEKGASTTTTCSFSYVGSDNDNVQAVSFSKDKYDEIVSMILSQPISLYTYPTDEAGKVLYKNEEYVMMLGTMGFEDSLYHAIYINLPSNFNDILEQFEAMKESALKDSTIEDATNDISIPEDNNSISIDDTDTYVIQDLTISLKDDGTGKQYYMLATFVLSMDKTNDDYQTYGSAENMDKYKEQIKAKIIDVFGSYTYDEIRQHENEALATILERIQKAFGSSFIYDVSLSSKVYQ